MLKPYFVQLSASETYQGPRIPRVDYDELFKTLTFPLLWVYEELLQAWLPREVDHLMLEKLQSYVKGDERFEKRLSYLGLLVDPSQSTRAEIADEMKRNGCAVVRGLFPKGLCELMSNYYFRQPETHERWQDMPGIKRTSVNNSPLMRLAHQSTESLAKHVLGDVKTSYSFTSAYESGTVLPKHTDRPQCLFNASVMLSIDPTSADPKRWPLMISIDGVIRAVKLNIGDAVYYSGVRDLHWRDQLPSDVHGVLGTFFHYVPGDFTGSLD